jgi:hypothetical protein
MMKRDTFGRAANQTPLTVSAIPSVSTLAPELAFDVGAVLLRNRIALFLFGRALIDFPLSC